jgi:hypothetical protein
MDLLMKFDENPEIKMRVEVVMEVRGKKMVIRDLVIIMKTLENEHKILETMVDDHLVLQFYLYLVVQLDLVWRVDMIGWLNDYEH